MRINNNLMAMNTHRQLGIGTSNGSKSMEKLSSGLRINRAGDDAAGLAISEKMRAQVRGLSQASKNAQDGISLIQTAEGALNETHAILQRMRELAVQSSNGTLDDNVDRAALNKEVTALKEEVDRIADQTTFNGKQLLAGNFGGYTYSAPASSGLGAADGIVNIDGGMALAAGATEATLEFDATDGFKLTVTQGGRDTVYTSGAVTAPTSGTQDISLGGFTITIASNFDVSTAVNDGGAGTGFSLTSAPVGNGSMAFQIGADASQTMSITIDNMNTTGLAIGGVNVSTDADATSAITAIENALNKVSTQRAGLGAAQNRLEHTIKNLDNGAENLQAAESRIRDVDMAKEMMEFTKNNILQQAAQAMLAQANQAPQGVLQLLR